jgi:hypothetical protein
MRGYRGRELRLPDLLDLANRRMACPSTA